MNKKQETNIKKDKWIDFQIAIIAVLCFAYVMYDVSTYTLPKKQLAVTSTTITDDLPIVYSGVIVIPNHDLEVKKTKSAPKKEINTKTISEPEIKRKDSKIAPIEEKPIVETKNVTSVKNSIDAKVILNSATTKNTSKAATINKVYNEKFVDVLPLFPGCNKKSSNNQRAQCFQEKVKRMILRKFNSGLGEELDLQGKQQIYLYFEINEEGVISNIKARSGVKELSLEAERVARLLPIMDPARSKNKKVKMSYTLPITFNIQ